MIRTTPTTPTTPGTPTTSDPADERLRRWRLVLGGGDADGTGRALTGTDAAVDGALTALYGRNPDGHGHGHGHGHDRDRDRDRDGAGRSRTAGLGSSAPSVARWLGDIRTYFPASVVQVMQRDAIDRLGLAALLLEPEMLAAVEPDVHLVGTLLSLREAMPETTRETARAVVRKVVDDLEERLAARTRATLTGALDRSARTARPRHRDIDWDRTIRANLKNYLPEHRTVVPERLVGHGRAARGLRKEVVLCVDQSGSMAASVVHAAVFGAVLASLRTIATRLVVFDTAVVDLTDRLDDPVDVLFGTRLGGGTDINRALAHCQAGITRPADTVVVLISDLYEGGIRGETLKRVAAMRDSGVGFVALLALSDEGTPAYDRDHAAALAALGVPAFACTPDLFPEVMAAALEKRPLPIPA
ncbi:VWA domain-containing protein [Streptomyces sp. WAC08241]|uniref:VWA domain-containing protein n=1 Tax=Streptomyces sp. WAC08241 TaxID=2487421 RepID=UPI000F7B1E2C|nr:VWA domain-containing protein [Streptomyces sp. WAC08241]RSS42547.1 VWA domain-containing protein [Streptomyces sp. WAC08241]